MQTGLAPTESRVNRRIVHFAAFEFDLQTRELRKLGLKIKLSGQPANVLAMLIERAGEVITREELQSLLWPADTYVDFEHSLNAAIKRLRAALGDSADAPRYIETLAGRGYSFIAPIVRPGEDIPQAPQVAAPNGMPHRKSTRQPRLALPAAIVAGLVLLALIGINLPAVRDTVRNRTFSPIRSIAVLPLANLSGD